MALTSSVIFFPCRDIAETRAYYTQVLGLPLYKDLGASIWLDCGYGYLGFVQYEPERPMASGACISFNLGSVEEVDAMYARLQTLPVLGLRGAPQRHPAFPVYSFFFSDPNGYTLEYQKTLD
ncbi:MAG: VOC family protein [Eubacteriales bacterium]|nr:VOC family protein [Eubacteriales bacterium]